MNRIFTVEVEKRDWNLISNTTGLLTFDLKKKKMMEVTSLFCPYHSTAFFADSV